MFLYGFCIGILTVLFVLCLYYLFKCRRINKFFFVDYKRCINMYCDPISIMQWKICGYRKNVLHLFDGFNNLPAGMYYCYTHQAIVKCMKRCAKIEIHYEKHTGKIIDVGRLESHMNKKNVDKKIEKQLLVVFTIRN